MHCLSPLLAVLESSDFRTQSDGKTDAWVSQTLSPSSLAEDALRREVRAFVLPVQPFCLSYVVDAFIEMEMDQMVYEILHGESRSRELVAIVAGESKLLSRRRIQPTHISSTSSSLSQILSINGSLNSE